MWPSLNVAPGFFYSVLPAAGAARSRSASRSSPPTWPRPGCSSGRYDRPFVELRLTPLGEATKTGRLLQASLSGYLGQIRQIDGQWIVTSASPTGEQLTIAPYRGDFGVLEIGPGGRAITELGLVGTLASSGAVVAVGDSKLAGATELPRRMA